jgi:hypothetical protein
MSQRPFGGTIPISHDHFVGEQYDSGAGYVLRAGHLQDYHRVTNRCRRMCAQRTLREICRSMETPTDSIVFI